MAEEHSPAPSASATEQGARQLSLESLAGEHRRVFYRATATILATDVAEVAYAQIIDGCPIEPPRHASTNALPIRPTHTELCPGMLEKAREFRDQFYPDILVFDFKLLSEFSACSPGSRSFKTRLVELVALAVHQIAVILFELDIGIHKHDPKPLLPPKSNTRYWKLYPKGPSPTRFRHGWYKDYAQYPRGVADMVGYWAEAEILGGVVLFDRRDPEIPNADPNAVYFHSCRKGVTYRIYQLLPEQRGALLDFLLAEETPYACPLPILGDANNRVRVDPQEPIRETGIYRDLWERKDYVPTSRHAGTSCVRNELDFPTPEDQREGRHRAHLRNQNYQAATRARQAAQRAEREGGLEEQHAERERRS